jgi:Spy/CpxP family protein refolding chaperone
METNKRKNLILILLFILLIINISMMITFFVFPKDNSSFDRKEKRMKHKEKMECLMQELQLSEQQEDSFFQLRDSHKETMRTLFEEVGSKRNVMINAIATEPPLSAEELYPYAQEIGSIEVKIQIETIDYFLKMRELLNPDQFGKLIDNFRDVCGCPHMKDKHKGNDHKKSKSCNNK